MLYLLKGAALGSVLSMNVLTLSAPVSALDKGLPGSAQTLGSPSTVSAPSLPDDTPAVEKSSRAPRWVVLDFVTGIATIEFADGSLHEELFEPETLGRTVLSTVLSAVPPDAAVTGSVGPIRR